MRMRRLFAIPAIAGAMLLGLAVAATPAYAGIYDMACNYDYVTFNACLNFSGTGDLNVFTARVGLDAFMPERYAQEIVSYGAGFRATLWGDDNGHGTYIADLTLTPGWPFAQSDRLSGELTASLSRDQLNEDDNYDEDELYAVVSYFDYHTGSTKVFRTGTVHGYFDPIGSNGGGCFVACH
jgi:hypothetical protein